MRFKSRLKKCLVLVAATAGLAACGTTEAKVTTGANDSGVACNADVADSTRLLVELQHCLVNEAIADFRKRPPANAADILLLVNQRQINNETDQTTVDPSSLADYIRRQLDIVAGVKSTDNAGFDDPTHTLEVTVTGTRVRGARGAAQVTYTLKFELKNFLSGRSEGVFLGDIKVQRGKRSVL